MKSSCGHVSTLSKGPLETGDDDAAIDNAAALMLGSRGAATLAVCGGALLATVALVALASLVRIGACGQAMNDGASPLFIACSNGHVDAVQLLIDKGADVRQADSDGHTPLIVACLNGHVDVVQLLIEKDADVGQADNNGMLPLLMACQNGHDDVARLLIEKGADVGQAKNNGVTPLLVSCFNGHDDVARLLIENGADVGQVGKKGVTPLHVACYEGHVDLARMLIEWQANVNALTEEGTSSLCWACKKGRADVARLLLRAGALPRRGVSALSKARKRSAAGKAPAGSAADLVLKAAAPWRPETHPLRSASARARAGELVRVGHLLSISGASLNRGIRTWLRSRVGRAFWLQVMSYVDMSAA